MLMPRVYSFLPEGGSSRDAHWAINSMRGLHLQQPSALTDMPVWLGTGDVYRLTGIDWCIRPAAHSHRGVRRKSNEGSPMNRIQRWVGATAMLVLPSVAVGQVLTFEGIAPSGPYGSAYAPIGNYYNGGGGPNYGIAFSDNALALCLNTLSNVCSNTSRGGLGDPNSQLGGLIFLSGGSTFMNSSAGFTTGFSLNYTAPSEGGSLEVWSGLDGTGSLLASLLLPTTSSGTCPDYSAGFCPFFPVGVGFLGTGHSIEFAGVANQIVFDDVTFGNVVPGDTVPEPASVALFGSGLIGLYGFARRRKSA